MSEGASTRSLLPKSSTNKSLIRSPRSPIPDVLAALLLANKKGTIAPMTGRRVSLNSEHNKTNASPSVVFNKEFLLLVPLAASAIAITYDAGYFAGIGGFYFTFFSINEHIAFALQVLPFAVVGAALLVWHFSHLGRIVQRRRSKEKAHKEDKTDSGVRAVGLSALILVLLAILGLFIYFTRIYLFVITLTVATPFIIIAIYSSKLATKIISTTVYVTIVTYAAGELTGSQFARPTMLERFGFKASSTNKIKTKNEGEIGYSQAEIAVFFCTIQKKDDLP